MHDYRIGHVQELTKIESPETVSTENFQKFDSDYTEKFSQNSLKPQLIKHHFPKASAHMLICWVTISHPMVLLFFSVSCYIQGYNFKHLDFVYSLCSKVSLTSVST